MPNLHILLTQLDESETKPQPDEPEKLPQLDAPVEIGATAPAASVAIDVVLTPDKEDVLTPDKEDQLETKLAQPERKERIADDGGLYQARTVTQREKLRGWITEWCRRYDDQRGICGEIAVQIAFELQLFFWSVWFGPYFTTAAAFTLALDAWRDDGSARERSPEQKNNELNGIVLGVAEACGESLPQLFAQSYFFVQDLNELSPIDRGIFASSATCCVGGILYAMYNMRHSYSDIQQHMRPPVMSARQMHALRISAKEARAVGHDVAELKDAGFSLDELMKDAAFSFNELKDAGFSRDADDFKVRYLFGERGALAMGSRHSSMGGEERRCVRGQSGVV